MPKQNLRSKIIRLAASLPRESSERQALLTVLRHTAKMHLQIDKTYEVKDNVRRPHLSLERGSEIPLQEGDLLYYKGRYNHGGHYQSDPIPTDHFELAFTSNPHAEQHLGDVGEFWPNNRGDASESLWEYGDS